MATIFRSDVLWGDSLLTISPFLFCIGCDFLDSFELEVIKDVIDDMEWSFSRLNSFYNCKLCWYKTYILKENKSDNFFSQYGTFFHKIMEKYNKKELELFELPDYFEKNYYINIVEEAPPNKYVDLNDSYFYKGYDYLINFQGYDDKTLSSEEPFSFYLSANGKKRKIVGFIDRISLDKNGIVVTDYKSKSRFKNKEELHKYARQLYIYSIAVKKKYGVYPYKLVFTQFRSNNEVEIKFNIEDLRETVKWIQNTISDIYNEKDFNANKQDFFCNYLCSFKGRCLEYGL